MDRKLQMVSRNIYMKSAVIGMGVMAFFPAWASAHGGHGRTDSLLLHQVFEPAHAAPILLGLGVTAAWAIKTWRSRKS
jgi:hypothetical protein